MGAFPPSFLPFSCRGGVRSFAHNQYWSIGMFFTSQFHFDSIRVIYILYFPNIENLLNLNIINMIKKRIIYYIICFLLQNYKSFGL